MRNTKVEVHMTKHLVSIFFVAAAIPLFAQDPHKLTANVPFNFTAGTTVFQAGDYEITKNSTGMITVRSADRRQVAMLMTMPVIASSVSATGRLVFLRSGERYFLSELWEPGTTDGSAVPPSRAERELRSRNGIPAKARVSVALR